MCCCVGQAKVNGRCHKTSRPHQVVVIRRFLVRVPPESTFCLLRPVDRSNRKASEARTRVTHPRPPACALTILRELGSIRVILARKSSLLHFRILLLSPNLSDVRLRLSPTPPFAPCAQTFLFGFLRPLRSPPCAQTDRQTFENDDARIHVAHSRAPGGGSDAVRRRVPVPWRNHHA